MNRVVIVQESMRSADMVIVERRAFSRQTVSHETILTLPDRTTLAVRIVEASERGMSIALRRPLATDTPVQLTFDGQVVVGRVCHCREARQGTYSAGLYLENTLEGLADLATLSRVLATEETVSSIT